MAFITSRSRCKHQYWTVKKWRYFERRKEKKKYTDQRNWKEFFFSLGILSRVLVTERWSWKYLQWDQFFSRLEVKPGKGWMFMSGVWGEVLCRGRFFTTFWQGLSFSSFIWLHRNGAKFLLNWIHLCAFHSCKASPSASPSHTFSTFSDNPETSFNVCGLTGSKRQSKGANSFLSRLLTWVRLARISLTG